MAKASVVIGRCLVTGASGFIGRKLCESLHAGGAHVRVLLRRPTEGDWSETIISELGADSVPVGALAGVEAVFHLAGRAHALSETHHDEEAYTRVNVEGTRRLLEAAKASEVRRFVFFSSVKAMGEGGDACLDESSPCDPETPYGKSKLEAEKLVLEGGYVSEPVVLRLSMVYGSSAKGNLPRMIKAVAKGCFPPLPDTGNKRSMVHVDDVVQAALLTAEKHEAVGKTFIVTDGTPYSTRQIYEWICKSLGKSVPNWHVPMGILTTLAKVGDGIGRVWGRRFVFDANSLEKLIGSAWYSSEKITKELGFHAKQNLKCALPEIVRYLGIK